MDIRRISGGGISDFPARMSCRLPLVYYSSIGPLDLGALVYLRLHEGFVELLRLNPVGRNLNNSLVFSKQKYVI